MAFLLAGGPCYPVPVQGAFSYTVSSEAGEADDHDRKATSHIVQFRVHHSSLDLKITQLAGRVHGRLVAVPEFHGEIGDGLTMPLKVYRMKKLPGISYIDMVLLSSKALA